jgi:hypothetical protein
MKKEFRFVLAAMSMLFVDAAWASDYCARVCKKPEGKSGLHVVTIDANSGQVTEGSVRLPDGQQVQLIFANKNPFKYDYRFDVTAQPIDTAVASAFLAQIPRLNLDVNPVQPVKSADPKKAKIAAKSACEEDAEKAWQSNIRESLVGLQKQAVVVSDFLKYPDTFNAFISSTDADAITNCEQVCSTAVKLKAWPHAPGTFQKAADDFHSEVNTLEERITSGALDGISKDCQNYVVADTKHLRDALTASAEKYNDASAEVEHKLSENAASIKQLDTILAANLDREDLFFEQKFPTTRDEPTAIRAGIFRRNLRTPDALERPVGVVELEVGRSVLSLSAGVMVSGLPTRRVVRQSALVATEADPTRIGLRFGYQEDSEITVSPVVFANVRLVELAPGVGFGLGFGLIAVSSTTTPSVEYAGVGFVSFARELLFLSIGAHVAERETLAGGFNIGDEVPAGLPDPIPTTRQWKGAFMGSLSLRFR